MKHCTKMADVRKSSIGLVLLRFYSPFQDGICLFDVFCVTRRKIGGLNLMKSGT